MRKFWKRLILASALYLATAASGATDLVSICANSHYATGYVYLDQYTVTVNTDIIDQFESQVMWTELHAAPLTVLLYPVAYRGGSYVLNQGYQTFYVKGDINTPYVLQQRLSNLAVLSSVSVNCRYVTN